MSNLKKTINEDIEHMNSWKDNNGEEVVFTILKNPTKKEFRDLLNHSKYKQLRGLCSVNADSGLLDESVQLNEGIEEVKKYYPKIIPEKFDYLIKLDPTYKGGNELGTYGKWILNLYNNLVKDMIAARKWNVQQAKGNNYPRPERIFTDREEDFEKLPNLLKKFDTIKNKAKLNINNIKSISDLYSVIEEATTYNGISTEPEVQHAIDLVKKSVASGGEVVFKDSNWIILIPKTFESSKVFGDDTNWCTTSSNGKYYNQYKREYGGDYLINVNLQDGSLYQFHFESEQFMDSSDHQIDMKQFAQNNLDLKQFYRKYILDNKLYTDYHTWVWLNDEDVTDEVKLEAVNRYCDVLKYIDNPSEELLIKVVQDNKYAIEYIDNPSEAVQLASVKHCGTSIKYIKNPSEQVQLEAVKQNGYALEYIQNPSEEIQLEAVKQNAWAISFINNPSEEIQLEAVKQDSRVIKFIKNPSEEVKKLYQQLTSKKVNESVQFNSEVIKNPSVHDWRKITHSNDDYRIVMNDKDIAISKALDDLHENIAKESNIANYHSCFTYQGKLYLEEDDAYINNNIDNIIKEAQQIYMLKPYKTYFNNGIYASIEDVKNNKPIKENTMTETVNFDLKLQLNDKWKYGSSINEIKSYIKKTITETFGNSYLSTNKQDNKTFNDTMTIHCITNKIPTDKLAGVYNKIKILESKGFTCKSDLTINVYNVKYNLQDYVWEQCNLALNENHYNCEKQLMTNKKQMFVGQLSNELKENNYSNIKTIINSNKELIETFIRNNKKTIIIENFNNISREDLLKLGVTLKNIQESSKFKKSYMIKESIDGMNKESFMTILF